MVETLHDIFNSRSQMSKELSDVKEHLQIALDSMTRGFSMYDRNQRLVFCNRCFCDLYALPRNVTAPGASLDRVVRTYYRRFANHGDDRTASQHVAWIRRQVALLEEGERHSRTQKLKDGRVLRITIQPLADGGWLDVHEDITEDSQKETKLLQLTVRDELTRLPNRRKFMERLNEAVEDVDVSGFSLHIIEISNYYNMLASIGLAARDACLKEIGRHVSALAGGDDLPARIDGDIFAILRGACDDEKDVYDFDLQLRTTLTRPIKAMGHHIDPGARVGSVLAPRDGRDVDMLLDTALGQLHE